VSLTDDLIDAYRTQSRPRRACGLCGSARLQSVVSLTPTPPAAAFATERTRAIDQPSYPLELGRCGDCGHVQLLHVVNRLNAAALAADPDSASAATCAELVAHAADLMALMPSAGSPLIVDIGCNDGTFLAAFEDAGWRVQGIDASANVAGAAVARGVATHANLFTHALAERIEEERGSASLVVAHRCFAEAADLIDVMDGVRALLSRDGLFAFETGYLGDVVVGGRVDAVTHATLDYHSVRPLKRFLASCDMELIHVTHSSAHRGGVLRGLAQRTGGPRAADASVARWIDDEARRRLHDVDTLQAFAHRIEAARAACRAERRALPAGCRLAGYGADPGTTTLLYHLGFGADDIDFIVDGRERRRGLFTPGLHIPILPPDALAERRPDAVIVLSDSSDAEMSDRLSAFRGAGGRVLRPLAAPA
jgi:SAM-dependent methyltransferase